MIETAPLAPSGVAEVGFASNTTDVTDRKYGRP